MLLALIVAVIAAVIARLRGGSFQSLAATEFRWPWLLWTGLVIQVGLDVWDPSWLSSDGALAVVLATNALVAAFLALNQRLPGMALAAIGMSLNVLVIAANGAMPVSASAAGEAELGATELGVKHELLTDSTRLPWLADVIPIPGLATLISVGDVVLAIGIAWFVYRRMMTPLAGRRGPRSPAASD